MHITAGIGPLSFAAVIDGVDGFQLAPSQAGVRYLRILLVALAMGTAMVLVLFAILALATGRPIWWLAAVVYVVLSAPADWVLWRVMQPPVLKSDGTTVTYRSGFESKAMPVADVGVVYLGLFAPAGRLSTGIKSYVFGGADGKVMFNPRAIWFREEDMKAFAERIGVPIRGDFTQRVTATVPVPTATPGF